MRDYMATRKATNAPNAVSGFVTTVSPLRYNLVSVGSVALRRIAVLGATNGLEHSARVANPMLVRIAVVSVMR